MKAITNCSLFIFLISSWEIICQVRPVLTPTWLTVSSRCCECVCVCVWPLIPVSLPDVPQQKFHQILSGKGFCLFVCLFWGILAAHGSSQARGRIGESATSLHHSHSIHAKPVTYTAAHGHSRSLTHWARPGMEPTSSWILVRFITAEPQWELHREKF